jgi:hypothetical protein
LGGGGCGGGGGGSGGGQTLPEIHTIIHSIRIASGVDGVCFAPSFGRAIKRNYREITYQ